MPQTSQPSRIPLPFARALGACVSPIIISRLRRSRKGPPCNTRAESSLPSLAAGASQGASARGDDSPMIPNDFPSLDFDLGETADQLRASVRGFTADEIAPLAADIDRSNEFPRQ